MPKNSYVHTRIDPNLKQQAELVFSRIGLNITDAISLFFTQVTLRDGLPFELTVPEGDTAYAQKKQALIDFQKAKLNEMLEEGEADLEAGLYSSGEASRKRTRERMQSKWESGRQPE